MSGDRVAHGRIAKRGPRRPPINGATLLPLNTTPVASSSSAARAADGVQERLEISKEELRPSNVRSASTLSLLRVRARNVRALYVRLWRCLVNNAVTPFKLDVAEVEGEGPAHVREANLLDWVKSHEIESTSTRNRIRFNQEATRRLKKANRGGGRNQRIMCERDEAVEAELARRTGDGTLLTPIPPENSTMHPADQASSINEEGEGDNKEPAVERSTPGSSSGIMYPASYADDIARIHRDLDAEEAGVRKPNRNDRLAAARVAAFQRGDMAIVKSLDAQESRRRDAKRRARQRKKQRKVVRRAELAEMVNRDPNSDNERS